VGRLRSGRPTLLSFKVTSAQQICIAIEVDIQNGTLAIAAGILNNQDMAIPAAIYSLFMYLTGFAAILYGKFLKKAPHQFTALCAQIQTKKNFERAALQPFQNFSCGSFDRQLL